MKRVYVAGKFADKDVVRDAQKLFKEAGHAITYDWTEHGSSIENKSAAEFAQDAEADVQGVLHADIVVAIMNDPKYPYVGTFGELCMALALMKRIFVVTNYLTHDPANVGFHKRCFYHHPSVTKVASIKDVLAAIND